MELERASEQVSCCRILRYKSMNKCTNTEHALDESIRWRRYCNITTSESVILASYFNILSVG